MENPKTSVSIRFPCVSDIAKARTIDEVVAGVTGFIRFSKENRRLKSHLCRQLFSMIVKKSKPYMKPQPSQNKNVVFIPPEASPVMFIPTCVPMTGDIRAVYAGLDRYLEKCREFIAPIEERVSEEEMNAVLDNAQKKFRVLDIIAPVKPFMILSFDQSHFLCNCQCGLSDPEMSNTAVIFVYSPRDISVCDRVFIFAHEIGHALHMALTGDVAIIPEKFDEFNNALGIDWSTLELKQEAFADVVAFAILNGNGLNEHLPRHFSESIPDHYDRYISYITGKHFSD